MSSHFYQHMMISVAAWWTLISSVTRRPLYDVTGGSVITIPSWLPKQLVLLMQRYRPFMFYCETIGISIACCCPNRIEFRVLAACLFTLYHLTEQSQTNRHGEFPILYIMWTMCLPNEELRQACAWGVSIHFVLSPGYYKLAVGGWDDTYSYPLWMHPSTIETYLTCYGDARSSLTRPLMQTWNARICRSRLLCSVIGLFTLLTECLVVPATLFLPQESRSLGTYAVVTMHLGIALVMSLKVGIVFTTTLPAYLYGFQCTAPIGSFPWIVAVILGLGPTLCTMLSGISNGMAENWPMSPFPLFMWNGKSAQCLLHLLMTGDVRMVFASTQVASKFDLKGLQVLHQGELVQSEDDSVVHDCVMRSIGFTVVHGDGPLVEAVNALQDDPDARGAAARALLHRTWAWLTLEKRLVEAHTGDDLTHVYLVRVDESLRVTEVLL